MRHPLPFISVIIPAYNEEAYIGRTLEALLNQSYPRDKFEIIAVDNGSSDKTPLILKKYVDEFRLQSEGHVAAVRNKGAIHAKGDLFAFLDADCIPDNKWLAEGAKAFLTGKVAFGYKVGIPKNAGWIERAWFSQRSDRVQTINYINSANFFILRDLFFSIKGFDEALSSGEDTDICLKIGEMDHTIYSLPQLKVIHLKNPRTISEFVKREIWHGIGGLQSFPENLLDKPLWATFFFMLSTTIQLSSLCLGIHLFVLGWTAILCLLIASSANTVRRFQNYNYFFQLIFLFYFYYIGRSYAVLKFIFRVIKIKLLNFKHILYKDLAITVNLFNNTFRQNRRINLRILCYHSISDVDGSTTLYPNSNVSLRMFKEQMKYLKEEDFYPVSFEELSSYLNGSNNIPNKSFIITFDDGFKNIKKYAIPILKDYGFNAIIFISTDWIDKNKKFDFVEWRKWEKDNNELLSTKIDINKGFLPLSTNEIQQLANMENIIIGSHGCDHKPHNIIPFSMQREQLIRSQNILKSITGQDIQHFAYPNGIYDHNSFLTARQIYRFIYSVEKGQVPPKAARVNRPIGRHSINRSHSLKDFKTQMTGGYDPFRRMVNLFSSLWEKPIK